MRDGFFHRDFFRVFAEVAPDDMRVDVLKGNNEVWCHELNGVDEKKWTILILFFHPKGDYFFETMHGVTYADTAVRYFKSHEVWWNVGEHTKYACGNQDEKCEECVVEENAGESCRNGDDTKRPIPIAPARYVLVFIRIPSQDGSLWGH